MNQFQPGILQPPPLAARYLSFSLADPTRLRESLLDLAELVDGDSTVLGLGTSLCQQLHANIPPLKSAPAYSIAGIDIPATPGALWLWMRGSDRGELLHRCRHFEDCLLSTFELDQTVEGFHHGDNQDLTGYRDGTENPTGDEAIEVAFDQSNNPGLHHSSCVAVQQWLHDFDRFALLDTTQKDFAIGRRLSDNEELDGAPASAHVRRTAQESFDPEAFLLRRSMPWV